MIDRHEVLGAVLAGGESRRMGCDKALLRVDGEVLISRPLRALRGVLDEVVVVSPSRQGYDELGAEIVPDLRSGQGPLAGLEAALMRACGRSVFVLACDMPFAGAEFVRYLVGVKKPRGGGLPAFDSRRKAGARVPTFEGRSQPLCALYGPSCLPRVEQALDENRLSARELVGHLQTERVKIDRSQPWFHPHLFMNVNDEDDYRRVAERLRAGREG